MTRRILPLIMGMLLVFLFVTPASADVLVPQSHGYKLQEVHATYVVPKGSTANLYYSPEKADVLTQLQEGETIYVVSCCTIADTEWGFTDGGWIRLGQLQKIYDADDFLRDYADQIQLAAEHIIVSEITEPIYIWTYPGSGITAEILLPESLALDPRCPEGNLTCHQLYTDTTGRNWGYIGTSLHDGGWIFLDDLHNPDPAFRLNPVVKNTVTDTNPIEEEPKPSLFSSLLWISLLIALVAAATAFVIYVLKRPLKSK